MKGLHVYPSTFTHESRMLKLTRALTSSGPFDSILIGAMAGPGLPEHEILDSRRRVWRVPLVFGRIGGRFGRLLSLAEWNLRVLWWGRAERPDVVNCHSLWTLPLGVALRLVTGCSVIYDTHELETEVQGSTGFRRSVARRLERLLITHVSTTFVVSDSIADWYRTTYRSPNFHVIRNIPDIGGEAIARAGVLRKAAGLRDSVFVFLYQGIVGPGRGILTMLEAFEGLDDRHLVVMGYGALTPTVAERAHRRSNIHFLPAVAPEDLLSYTADADVGLLIPDNTCLSYYYSLPNKVFEYLKAGLPIIVSDFPELSRLVAGFGCGWVVQPNAQALRVLVAGLSLDDIRDRGEAVADADRAYSWADERRRLLDVYSDLGLA